MPLYIFESQIGFSYSQDIEGFPKSAVEAIPDMYEFLTQDLPAIS